MRFPECLPSLIYLITDHLFILSLITYFITCLSFISRSLYVSGYSKFCFNFLLPLINSLDMCTYNLKIYCLFNVKGFPGGASGKEPTCQCRRLKSEDADLIPGLGKSAAEGNGNPFQYYCLENSTDRGAWPATVHRVAKSRKQSDYGRRILVILLLQFLAQQHAHKLHPCSN